MSNDTTNEPARDFIRDIVREDVSAGRHQKIVTRFPPEPNGYLHIGHAKSICLNFGIAAENSGICNLRMDDTNPTKEEVEYVESIQHDVNWLIAGWADERLGLKPKGKLPLAQTLDGRADYYLGATSPTAGTVLEPFYASDYFEQLYEYALQLIRKGVAYVCDLSPQDTDAYRGAPDRAGQESPFRNRTVAENLDRFQRMKAREFPDGTCTLRAKIDMTSPNVWLRDPIIYRIRHAEHHHTGNAWCIYPMYDFAHCLSDYIEGITHSICTLEFEVHRPLYDWILTELGLPRTLPHQYEFARLNLTYTIMSKRKLLQLVKERRVTGWDDPRMPTIAGLRRRGYPAAAIRHFCRSIGVTKYNGTTDVALLENSVREDLNKTALRRCAVLQPLEVIIENYPVGQVEELDAVNNPENPADGTRRVPFSRRLYIEQDDFREVPPKKYFRLAPGQEVRLRYGYIIKCERVEKDAAGQIVSVHCSYDPATRGGNTPDGRKIKGTIHWVSADHALCAEVRLYDRLFTRENPDADGNFLDCLNADSLKAITGYLEPSLAATQPGDRVQFERLGYFFADPVDSKPGQPVFNRIVGLRDSWAKLAAD